MSTFKQQSPNNLLSILAELTEILYMYLSCAQSSVQLVMDVSIDGRRTLFNFFLSETTRHIKKMF